MTKIILTLEETFARLGVDPNKVNFKSEISIPILHESIRGYGPYIPCPCKTPGLVTKRAKLSENIEDWHDSRPDENYDPEQLRIGIEVEKKEHTNDEGLAKKIALDHLDEDPFYYSKLTKAEL